MAGAAVEPLHPPALLIDGDERHQRRIGVQQVGGEQAELPLRADIRRIKHHATDEALGELVAQRLDARVVLALAGEAHHDRLADHPVEPVVGLRHLAQRGEPVGLGGAQADWRTAQNSPPQAARGRTELTLASWLSSRAKHRANPVGLSRI